jgi:hypothetical protein
MAREKKTSNAAARQLQPMLVKIRQQSKHNPCARLHSRMVYSLTLAM